MSPLRDEDKHDQQGDNHEKDTSGLRKATASGEGEAWVFSYKASPEQLRAEPRRNHAEMCQGNHYGNRDVTH